MDGTTWTKRSIPHDLCVAAREMGLLADCQQWASGTLYFRFATGEGDDLHERPIIGARTARAFLDGYRAGREAGK